MDEIQHKYVALLTNEFQYHNDLCEKLGIPPKERERFIHNLAKWTDIEYKDSKGYGHPVFIVRLQPSMATIDNSQNIHIGRDLSGNLIQSLDSANLRAVTKPIQKPETKRDMTNIAMIVIAVLGLALAAWQVYKIYYPESNIDIP